MKYNIYKKFAIAELLVVSLLLGLYLFYNQNETSAQGDITYCDPEIPIGEAFEKAVGVLQNTQDELEMSNDAVMEEIEAANKMISLASGCSVTKCQPQCSKSSFNCGSAKKPATCYSCSSLSCSGEPCEKGKIQTEYNRIESSFNELTGASVRIKEFTDKSAEVEELLFKARQGFDNCSMSIPDWLKADKGEKSPKYPLSCPTVLKEGFSRKNANCQSLHNFYCCY